MDERGSGAAREVADPRRTAPVVFPSVVGCPRSGTTLLRAMLDSHPALAVPPEADWVLPLLQRPARYETAAGLDRAAVLRDVSAHKSLREWPHADAVVKRVASGPAPADLSEATLAFYAAYAAEAGKPRYGDKTPRHVLFLEMLAGRFPGARFVHIVRDGRDVVPSLIDMHFGPDRFGEAVLFWQRRVETGRLAGHRLGPARYLEVRYEDLVSEPERELRTICTFADLEFVPEMLGYADRADEILTGLRHTHHVQGIRRPPTAAVRDWRTALDPRRLAVFEAIAGSTLDELGYERSGVTVDARARAAGAAWRFAVELERRTRSLRTRAERKLHRPAATTGRT